MAEGLANSHLLMSYSNQNPNESLNIPKVTVYIRFTFSCFPSPKGFYSCLNARRMFLHQIRLFPDLVGLSEPGHKAISNLTTCQDVFQDRQRPGDNSSSSSCFPCGVEGARCFSREDSPPPCLQIVQSILCVSATCGRAKDSSSVIDCPESRILLALCLSTFSK